jgi:type I restriction enzyme S subunit
MGQAPPASESNFEGRGTVFVKAGEFGKDFPVVREWTTKPLKFAVKGDVLVCVVGATAGKLNLAIDCAIGRSVAAIRPAAGVSAMLLYRQLALQVQRLRADSTGSAQGVISKEMLSQLELVLPPEREQQRIADKLDTVLARVDSVNARLARVAPLLKRFRQSVLAAATSGRLTANMSIASNALGHEAVEPAPPTWKLARLSAISDVIDPNPKHRNPIYQDDGELFLSTTNFADSGGWNLEATKRVSKATVLEQQARCKFTRHSLVFSRKGTIGKVRIVPLVESFALLDSLVVINAKEGLSPGYLLLALQSPIVQEQVVRLTRGVALKQVSVGVVRSLEIPLPEMDEQTEIVRRVELLFGFADRLEARLQAAQTASSRLTPSLLAKAFRGELVPQDPNDEPASELLKRLAQSQPVGGAKKKGRAASPKV